MTHKIKGPRTTVDCHIRQWNNGANAVCIGCVEGGFPDKFSPFYSHEDEDGSETDSDGGAATDSDEHVETPERADVPEITVVGVEPGFIGWSMDLSPEVQASLPVILATVRKLLRENN